MKNIFRILTLTMSIGAVLFYTFHEPLNALILNFYFVVNLFILIEFIVSIVFAFKEKYSFNKIIKLILYLILLFSIACILCFIFMIRLGFLGLNGIHAN